MNKKVVFGIVGVIIILGVLGVLYLKPSENVSDENLSTEQTDESEGELEAVGDLRPDLIIVTVTTDPPSPKQEELFTINIQIKNVGKGSIENTSFWVSAGDREIKVTKILRENNEMIAEIPAYHFMEGLDDYYITVSVDTRNDIIESHEDNNDYEKLMTVGVKKCSDGTFEGDCVEDDRPKRCVEEEIVDDCDFCRCPSGETCQGDGTCA